MSPEDRWRPARRATKIEPRKLEFLIDDRIPVGFLSAVVGLSSGGKSLYGSYCAKKLSRKRKNIIVAHGENPAEVMTIHRLIAAEARLHNCLVRDVSTRYHFPEDLRSGAFEDEIVKHKVKMVYIDPIASQLSGISKHQHALRDQVLDPLQDIAARNMMAITITDHNLRSVSKNAPMLNAVSQAISQVCQFIYVMGKDPKDEEEYVLYDLKPNVVQRALPMAFTLTAPEDRKSAGSALTNARELKDGLDFDERLLLYPETGKAGRPADKLEACCAWLTNLLINQGATKASMIREAGGDKFSRKTIDRAASQIGVVKDPSSGGSPNTTWALPEETLEALRDEAEGPTDE